MIFLRFHIFAVLSELKMPKSKAYVSDSDDSSEEVYVVFFQISIYNFCHILYVILSLVSQEVKSKKQKKEKETEEKAVSSKKAKSEDEDSIWDLGNNRQVNVRNFKGKYYVDIREMYYDKDGDLKPGKKGDTNS